MQPTQCGEPLVATVTAGDVDGGEAVCLTQQLDPGLRDVLTETHTQVHQVVAPTRNMWRGRNGSMVINNGEIMSKII